ncbi:MAG: response regulator [Proteobacteria bacterium]|nr:response regulator [Pseudomonadota bacterium]
MRVLVIEDDINDVKLVRRYLGKGARGDYVICFADAVAALAKNSYDIALLDLGLPESSGLNTLSRLRKIAPTLPIVIISALEDEAVARKAVQQGAQDYLVKGKFDADLLHHTLRYGLERQNASQQYLALLEQSPDGVLLISLKGEILFTNAATEELLGKKGDKLKGQLFGIPTVSEGETPELQLPGGRTAELRVAEIKWENKPAYLTMLRDITGRKNAQLELERQAKELKASNIDLERFAHVVSYTLQAPLRGIRTYVQILIEDGEDTLDQESLKNIAVIDNCADHAQNLVKNLMTFSVSQRKPYILRQNDIQEILEEAIDDLALEIKKSKAKITHGCLPKIVVDYGQFLHLIENLIDNAIKFRGKKAPRVHLSARKNDTEWIFSVADNGIGIDKKYYEEVFQVFEQLHPQMKYSGTGIGLAVCKKIVNRHNGRIWLESKPGQGSTFYFSIPFDPRITRNK